ncbi:MAG: DUF1073 domain-containing protein [Deltaproteobacteria bacterium]|jgi:phage-related protein (TIGR01555 family)|nr:DUF1073 domain-containing protein [Deltaproteobacteria bacterium]
MPGFFDFSAHGSEMGITANAGFMLNYQRLALLAQNGVVRACISAPVMDMFRNWIELARTSEAGELRGTGRDDGLKALESALETFRVKRILQSAAEQTGYFGGCFVFVDTGVRGAGLAEPLLVAEGGAELRPGGLRRFQLIEPANVTPGYVNMHDPLEEDFYRPESWQVGRDTVHRTRLIGVSGAPPPQSLLPAYNYLGVPQAQIIADYAMHFQSDRLQASGLLKNVASKVLKTDMMNAVLSGGSGEDMRRRIEYFVQNQDNNGVLVIDKEREDFLKEQTSLGGVTDIVQQALELVCAVNGTPVTKTLGLSPKGFNATGETDLQNYYDRVRAMQEEQVRPPLETMLRVLQLHLTGRVDTGVTFRFVPLSDDDRKLEAEVQKLRADTSAVYLDRGVVSAEEVRRNLVEDPESGFDDEDPAGLPADPSAAPGAAGPVRAGGWASA